MPLEGARKADILATAASVFATSGLRASLQEVADACGILPGSLYHHFESKEAIFIELVEQYQAELDAIVEKSLEELRSDPRGARGADPRPRDGNCRVRGPQPRRPAPDLLRAARGRQ